MLKLEKINISFGKFSLKDVDLEVKKGEYHVILGPSGAGKSVLMSIIAGFKKPESGKVFYESKDITGILPQKREIALLFQELALFPHMNVFNNVAFPLKIRKTKSAKIQTEVLKYLELSGIQHLKDRQISDLSGGEKQRVAIARCLITGADLLLLDEPLTAIDEQLRTSLKILLKEIQELGKTIIHVTHDLKETRMLADKISVIENGELVQTGTYDEIFNDPISLFTASFNEGRNYFKINHLENDEVMIEGGVVLKYNSSNFSGTEYGIYIKPECLMINHPDIEKHCNKLQGEVVSLTICGDNIEVIINAGISLLCILEKKSFIKSEIQPGDKIMVSFLKEHVKTIIK